MRREMGRYDDLHKEGLIAAEVYDNLKNSVTDAQTPETRPRLDLGLDTRRLIAKLDLFANLTDEQLERVEKLLRPRFAVPHERIVRKGDRGDAVYFIASGAVEVAFADRRIELGSGDVFGEMALLTGMRRQADVVASTYSRLLVLREADFDRFMKDNRDVRSAIKTIAATRHSMNISGEIAAASGGGLDPSPTAQDAPASPPAGESGRAPRRRGGVTRGAGAKRRRRVSATASRRRPIVENCVNAVAISTVRKTEPKRHATIACSQRSFNEIGRRHRRVHRHRLGLRQSPRGERISRVRQRPKAGGRGPAVEGVRREFHPARLRRDRRGGGRRGR